MNDDAPGWKDGNGVVHIVATHNWNRVTAECGWIIASGGQLGCHWPPYEDTVETPTCLLCIGSVDEDTVPWTTRQLPGVSYINTAAISKLNIKI